MKTKSLCSIFIIQIVGGQELVPLKDKNLYLFSLRITKKADLQQDQPIVFYLSIFLNHSCINHWHLRCDIRNQLMYLTHIQAGFY